MDIKGRDIFAGPRRCCSLIGRPVPAAAVKCAPCAAKRRAGRAGAVASASNWLYKKYV